MSLFHPKESGVALLDDDATLSQIGEVVLGSRPSCMTRPSSSPVDERSDVQGQARLRAREPPGLQHARHQIGAYFVEAFAQLHLRPGTDEVIHGRTAKATMTRQNAEGLEEPPQGMPPDVMTISSLSLRPLLSTWMEAIRRARGAINAIMLGMASSVMVMKTRQVLALVGHELELPQGDREPHDAGQRGDDQHERGPPPARRCRRQNAHHGPRGAAP